MTKIMENQERKYIKSLPVMGYSALEFGFNSDLSCDLHGLYHDFGISKET